MIKGFLTVILLCISIIGLHGQERNTGLNFPQESTYRNIAFPAIPKISLGEGFDEDFILQDAIPPVDSQDKIGSCASWSTTYYLFSMYNAKKKGFTNFLRSDGSADPEKIFNPLYTHNQVIACKNNCAQCGTSNFAALDFLYNYGAVNLAAFSLSGTNNPNSCKVVPSPALKASASQNRIVNYGSVINPYGKYEPGEKYGLIKNALLSNFPVVIGMPVDAPFKNGKGKDYQWKNFVGNAAISEGHSMLCIGFSDKRNAILVVNSWGKDWGDQGRGWISAEIVEKYLGEAFVANVPATSLIPNRAANDVIYTAQATGLNLSEVTKLSKGKAEEAMFIRNRYLDFDDIRIIPERVDAGSGILKFYRKDDGDFSLIDIVPLKLGDKYPLKVADKSYIFSIYNIKRWKMIGPRAIHFTIIRTK